jgi:hypothetical protein
VTSAGTITLMKQEYSFQTFSERFSSCCCFCPALLPKQVGHQRLSTIGTALHTAMHSGINKANHQEKHYAAQLE